MEHTRFFFFTWKPCQIPVNLSVDPAEELSFRCNFSNRLYFSSRNLLVFFFWSFLFRTTLTAVAEQNVPPFRFSQGAEKNSLKFLSETFPDVEDWPWLHDRKPQNRERIHGVCVRLVHRPIKKLVRSYVVTKNKTNDWLELNHDE